MKLIVGLGNPGKDYNNTRHNVGFMVIDQLKSKMEIVKGTMAFKSDSFMNESGEFVKHLITLYPNFSLSNLFIVHDDLDIRLGEYKIQFGRGPKDHNGLKSIDDKLGTDKYWHVRVGIDNRPFDNRPLGQEYVLERFTDEERRILEQTLKEVHKKLINQLNQ